MFIFLFPGKLKQGLKLTVRKGPFSAASKAKIPVQLPTVSLRDLQIIQEVNLNWKMEIIHLHNKKFNIQFRICSPERMVSRLSPGRSGHLEKEKIRNQNLLTSLASGQNRTKDISSSGKAEMESLARRVPALKVIRAFLPRILIIDAVNYIMPTAHPKIKHLHKYSSSSKQYYILSDNWEILI